MTAADDAWPQIAELIASCPTMATVIDREPSGADDVLAGLGVTTRSFLGALISHAGLVLVDHGWVTILGSGSGEILPPSPTSYPAIGGTPAFDALPVAYDVLGGVFAVHTSGFDADPGEVLYWAPDSLDWTPTGLGHSALVRFLLSDRLELFARDLRWPGWEADCAALAPGQGLSAWPPPFSTEGRPGRPVSRRPAPLAELVDFGFDMARQLDGV